MFSTNIRRYAVAAAMIAASAGCTVHSTEPPSLTGPSQLAMALRVTASPASIPQDGASTSCVVIQAFDDKGNPKVGVPLRVDMMVGGAAVEYGTLSRRSLTTETTSTCRDSPNLPGAATVIYTAPPTPPNGINGFGLCDNGFLGGVPGNCVSIVATVTNGSNFANANPDSVLIRLMPPGDIVLTGDWTFVPAVPKANQDIAFNGSGVLAQLPGRTIVTWRWDFNDGSSPKTGPVVTHDFGLPGTYHVVLTTTDDVGQTKSIPKDITVTP
jgi:PKD domain-containing protein